MENFDRLREVATVESFICEARVSEFHLALTVLATDVTVKRSTSGEMAEPALDLFLSVHGAHYFSKDDAGRKKVAQLEVWKRLSDAMREIKSLGPDLPKRAAAPCC